MPRARGARAVRGGELLGDPRRADRVRAVRPRTRRVHRRHAVPPRPLRGGARRHVVSGRGRRPEPARPDQAAARAAGGRAVARRRQSGDPGRRARGGGDESRAARARPGRGSARISTSASRSSRSRCRRCASAPRTSRCWSRISAVAADRAEARSTFSSGAIELLRRYPFPGNVRELRNLVERLIIMTPGATIGAERCGRSCRRRRSPIRVRRGGRGGRVRAPADRSRFPREGGNMTEAASRLGLERSHLYKKLRKLGGG